MLPARLRVLLLAAFAMASALSAACGSSATSTTAPAQLPRCGISLNTSELTVPAAGGSGTLSVIATRECVWSTEVDGGWLSIKAGANGQGEGTVEFAAAPNLDPRTRAGGLIINGTRAQITQSAAECVITLAGTSADFPAEGGAGRVDVQASSQLCTWTAESDASWVTITSGASGSGSGPVMISVAPTTGSPRAGTLTVAGQRFSVTQSQGCDYAIDRAAQQLPSAGGSGTVTIATAPACPWTAASNVPWISIAPPSGTGPAPVTFNVAPTTGPQRTGTAVIAGQLFTITQSPGCSFDVAPAAHSVGAAGGTATVTVSTVSGCAWTATSGVPWITIQGATSGSGPANVTFAVAPTSGPARTGVVTIAGRPVTVTQSQGCTVAIAPESQSVPAGGGSGTVTVTAGEGCGWTATSPVPWVTITAGSSGSGSGTVRFDVAATSGPTRSADLTIAGRTFTITQGEGCSYALSPTSANVSNDGGQRTFEVQAAAGCAWTAFTATPWITIDAGASGTGNGTVRFTAAANTGPGRSGSITAAGQTFTVSQGQGCNYALSASSADVANAGGQGSFEVQTAGGCAWTATTSAPWLAIDAGASGTGTGTVRFTAAPNTGPGRTGSIAAGGQTFTVRQGEGCTFALSAERHDAAAGGGTGSVNVTAGSGCGWTASSNAAWLSITSGSSGSGNGTVGFTAAANTGPARSGTLTIAGRTFTVDQAAGCTYAISPTSRTVSSGPGDTTTAVTASNGCAWTSASNAPWITITSGAAGIGSGTVELRTGPNNGPARTGTATIAGQTFTIHQEGRCEFAVTPETVTAPAAENVARVAVTTTGSCAWTAASNDAWIAVTGPTSGTGSGAIDLTIAANTGPARTGSALVAGRTVTVTQESGCVVTITPPSQDVAAAGGTGSVTVQTTAGCGWTAVSSVAWIVVTAGASGTGDGMVQFTVDVNATGAPRSGTIAIGGQVFTVNQQ